METSFTPLSSLAGGILIGLAAVLLMAAQGRIAGISGIIAGLMPPQKGDAGWRLAFIGGLLAAPLLLTAVTGNPPEVVVTASTALLVGSGLLVGYGVRLGSGCTSGHGVCGIARLSPRSLVATGIFVGVAMVTVFVVRHVMGA